MKKKFSFDPRYLILIFIGILGLVDIYLVFIWNP